MANWDLTLGPAGVYVVDASEQRVYVIAPDGTVYVAENRLDQVTEVRPDGASTVIAGNGESSWTNGEIGDGGPATDAVLARPTDVAVDADGTIYVSSPIHGIRRIDTDGTISTILDWADEEDGSAGVSPTSMDFDGHGNLYFAEPDTGLVRVLVRPGEMAGPFPWGVVMGAGGVLVVAGAALLGRRRRAGAARVSAPI
ncbi:MAG TPA: hypothetical protein VIP77_11945 [Jiangellaceae bacterium]